MKRVLLFMAIVIMSLTKVSYGQDGLTDTHTIAIGIPQVALLDIEGTSKAITMLLTAPVEAGLGVTDATDATLWLNYSSIKASAGATRTVSVKLSAVTAGVDLKVAAAAAASGYVGTVGTVGSQLTLTTSDQVLISSIGSCYTQDGASKGHQLTYTLTPQSGVNYGDIVAQTATTPITVTYTISN